MKTNTIKLVYPQHFTTCFTIEDNAKIQANQLLDYLKDRGILHSDDQTLSYHIFQQKQSNTYSQTTQCHQGQYFILSTQDTSQIQQHKSHILSLQTKHTDISSQQQKTWALKQQKLQQQRQRLSKIIVPKVTIKHLNNFSQIPPVIQPIKIEIEQQNIQNTKIPKTDVITKKTLNPQEQLEVMPATAKINKKNILNIIKLAQTNQDQQTVSIKYYLGKVLIREQQVKKMSVIRNQLKDLYQIYQDQQCTQLVKKVTIALGDRQFYCKKRSILNTRYNKQEGDQFEQSSPHKENPEEPTKQIFRISKKKYVKNQNNQSINVNNNQLGESSHNSPETKKIFNIKRTANITATQRNKDK